MSESEEQNIEAAHDPGTDYDGFEQDPRKILALHPADAGRIFSSQGSYGPEMSADFRTNVKQLSMVYEAIQRYLTGVFRREDVFYPELQDVSKDLLIYKRSISDKIPMPNDEDLAKQCLCLAAQNPAFIHVVREVAPNAKAGISFVTRYVAPTDKHTDKVIVGYRSTIQTSLRVMKAVIETAEFGYDYATLFQGVASVSELPFQQGRADFVLRGMYVDEKSLGAVTQADIVNIRKVNQEIYKRLYRPLLIQAVRDRLLVSLSCDDVRKAGFTGADKVYDVVLFAKTGEIQNRFAALSQFVSPQYMGDWMPADAVTALAKQQKAGEISNYEYYSKLAGLAYEKLSRVSEPPIREVQLAVEVMKLGDWLKQFSKHQAKTSEQNELRDVVAKIKAFGNLYRTRNNRSISINETFLRMMLQGRVPGIIACTEPFLDASEISNEVDLDLFDNIHIIYKDRQITAKAVDMAIELFEKTEDTYLLRMLENVFGVFRLPDAKIKEYLAPVYIDRLRRAVRKSYVKHLPWWSRLILLLTSSEISDASLARIRGNLQTEEDRRLLRIRGGSAETTETEKKKQARQEVRKLARQRAEDSEAVQTLGTEENKLFETMKSKLNQAWERGRYPIRDDLEKMGDAANKLLDMVDVGAASVRGIVRIPIQGYHHVYGSREYLAQNRDEIIRRCEEKLKEDVIIHDNREMLVKEKGDGKRELHQGLLDYMKYRFK